MSAEQRHKLRQEKAKPIWDELRVWLDKTHGAVPPQSLIMPPVGLAMGGVDFSNMKLILKAAAKPEDVVSINYGTFVNTVISFLILSLAIFALVKAVSAARKRMEATSAKAAAQPPPRSEVLLQEIRDALVKH